MGIIFQNKSSSIKQWTAKSRGDYAEERVHDYFLKRHCRVLYHRKKIFGVEYDWVFESSEGLIYVEVKSVKSAEFYLKRWPWKQKQRFLRVANALAAQKRSSFYLALVDYEDRVHLFKVGEEI